VPGTSGVVLRLKVVNISDTSCPGKTWSMSIGSIRAETWSG
jgi:hypothetical protein